MAPTPQEHVHDTHNGDPGCTRRVVISGMSGTYPEARNVKELADILYSKENPIKNENCRYKFNHPEAAQYVGVVPDLEYFDAQFFKVHYRLGVAMDPMSRKVLEHSYQAIFDAGVCPEALWGKRVGVFMGVGSSETEKAYVYNTFTTLGIVGVSRSMFSNRISYWLNAKGPSHTVEGSCCSSLLALEMAHKSIASGECDAALVAGAKLFLHPHSSVNCSRVTQMTLDGKTKSFDQNASGCAFSEAINVLFLQRAEDALRVYAEVTHVKCEFDTLMSGDCGPRFGFQRETQNLTNFISSFYKETHVSPQEVGYVEAFGAGVLESDKAELEAIDAVYCKNRKDPLHVGSVMSNVGYSEAASGITAITKVLLGYQNGKLAANLHLENERQDIACLKEGRVQLLKEHFSFQEGYAAVNSLSITGLNGHALFKYSYKPKNLNRYKSNIPYLVPLSGRQESAVQKIIDELIAHPLNPEQIALLHNIHLTKTTFHMGKGFAILDTNGEKETVCLSQHVSYCDDVKRPLWFVYSGMGSQWAGMGGYLMEIPIFAKAIEKCNRVLAPKGIDIMKIISSTDKKMFDNILHSFVGIAAIQIGLTDVLHELGLVPDKIIGHSVGELGCAYADGCFTAEEMILAAYYRGLVSLETPLIRGGMAAVGLGYQQVINMCPPDIEVACHNSSESCTVSGPEDSIKAFADKLTADGIFCKQVPCSNIAYHSRYIADAGPGLLKYLSQLIKSPKRRSERWVCTSVPKDKQNTPAAMYSSAEYHTNNLLSPVLFEESSQEIPADAVLLEVAPHGLLQAILKRSLPENCVNIPLTRRGSPSLVYFLEAIGKTYMQGFTPKVSVLYPQVQFPVSTGTPMLGHLVEWAHAEKWTWPCYVAANAKSAAACKFVVSTHDDEYSYLRGHILREQNVYPFAAVLVDVWATLEMSLKLRTRGVLPVHFRDVCLHAQPALHDRRQLRLSVTLHRASGRFEVMDGETKVATGFIIQNIDEESTAFQLKSDNTEAFDVTSEEFYEMAFNRDYGYREEFRSVHSTTSSLTEALILWRRNWVTLIDGILHFNAMRRTHETVSLPKYIRRLCININEHYNNKTIEMGQDEVMVAHAFDEADCIRCGGVVIENIQYRDLPPLKRDNFALEALKFSSPLEEKTEEENSQLQTTSTVQLKPGVAGNIDSVQWVQKPSTVADEGVDVTVYYAGLNSTDIEHDSRKEVDSSLGMDFSGKLNNGFRVMGIMKNGSVSSQIRVQREMLWPVPAHWSLEDAATVPLAYCLAYYCLVEKHQVLPGMRVFVENGVSAFGQALIAVCAANACDVFTSVHSRSEKQHLLTLFPWIPEDHVCSSRGTEFVDMVLGVTKGHGCDFVISSPKGELMSDTLRCVSKYGVAIITDYGQECHIGMYYLSNERNVFFFNQARIFKKENSELLLRLQKMVGEGVVRGVVRPLSRVAYCPQSAARALRVLAAGGCGRVLLHLNQEFPPVKARLSCAPDKLQLIVCDNEALGLVLAEKLVLSGCKKLHIHSQRPLKYIATKLKQWLKQDISVSTSSEDLSKENNVRTLLSNCNKAAPVEGIHFVITSKDVHSAINYVDLVSRKLCQQIKYFTILSQKSVGQDICVARRQLKLPATMLKLSNLSNVSAKYGQSGQGFTRWEAINALEAAVLAKQTVVHASKPANKQTPQSILSGIAEVSNISVSADVDPKTTLAELGIDAVKARQVAAYLKDVHNVSLSEQEVLALTIKRLNEIEDIIFNREFKQTKGLDTFFTYVEPDELTGTLDITFPPTLNSNLAKVEIASQDQHIIILPGMEGFDKRFENLCARLKLPALVLQPGVDHVHERPDQQARRYVQTLLKNLQLQSHFYLLGYEMGVVVALEMVSILEQHGFTGTVFCVGGGPQAIRTAVDKVASNYRSEEELQKAVTRHMVQLMTGTNNCNAKALEVASSDGLSWDSRVDACVRLILGGVSHSAQYARRIIETAYARLQTVLSYEIKPRPFRSSIVVLSCQLGDVAELQKFSVEPVKEYQLRAPLGAATDDLRCAAIVNRHLSPQILLEFRMKNRCEQYNITSDCIANC